MLAAHKPVEVFQPTLHGGCLGCVRTLSCTLYRGLGTPTQGTQSGFMATFHVPRPLAIEGRYRLSIPTEGEETFAPICLAGRRRFNRSGEDA